MFKTRNEAKEENIFSEEIEKLDLINYSSINENFITIKNKIFEDDNDYNKFLDKFIDIKFINCTFDNCFSDSIVTNNNSHLKFDKCILKGNFSHIICESIIFENCEIENYNFSNNNEDKIIIEKLLFINSKIKDLELEGVILKYQLFKNNNNLKEEYKIINSLILKNSIVEKNFIIYLSEDNPKNDIENDIEKFKINKLDLSNTIFNEDVKVKIQFCEISDAIFFNSKFKDLADFYQSIFYSVNFKRTDFEKIVVFSECEFYCNVYFLYTKFLSKSIFRDTVVTGELDLRNSIFDDEANFLDITSKKRLKINGQFIGEPTDIKVANRETARIIKNFYDNSNNIIEANRFYKLEMNKRLEEFKNFPSTDFRTFEKSVFRLHWISSNHSQNWLIPLFWIIIITFLYSLLSYYDLIDICKKNLTFADCNTFSNILNNKEHIATSLIKNPYIQIIMILYACMSFSLILFLYFSKKSFLYSLLLALLPFFYFTYGYLTKDYNLKFFSSILNPFSIMTGVDKLTFFGLIYKSIIAYLIYQFIISIRQNTRRN